MLLDFVIIQTWYDIKVWNIFIFIPYATCMQKGTDG